MFFQQLLLHSDLPSANQVHIVQSIGLAYTFFSDSFSPALSALVSSYLITIESVPKLKLWKAKQSIDALLAMQFHCKSVHVHANMLFISIDLRSKNR